MAEVICYIDQDIAQVHFAVGHVLRRMLGWDARIVTRHADIPGSDVPVIVHAKEAWSHGLHVPPRSTPQDPDVFTFAWRLLSLPEDHQHKTPVDAHGRVPLTSLAAYRNGWLQRPVLDEAVLTFADEVRAALPGLPPVKRTYRHVATMDVDNGFMYLGPEWWRTLASAARDAIRGDTSKLGERMRVLRGSQADPYDVLPGFRELAGSNADRSIVNFLVSDRGPNDHAVGTRHALMRQRMNEVAAWAEVGIHPSYASSSHPSRIAMEKARLEQVIGRAVRCSRQHFLRMRLPSTYHHLMNVGVTEEHSIGLSDAIGFRAGTCTPFPYFDPAAQRETDLMLWPFAVMDSAMAYRMRLTPRAAVEQACALVDRVRAVQGTFIGVWHERFLSDHGAERGWRDAVSTIIRYAKA